MEDFDASSLNNDDFKALQQLLTDSFLPPTRHQLVDFRYSSNCSPSTVVARLLGWHSKIIAAKDIDSLGEN
jgi:hypothetical protein